MVHPFEVAAADTLLRAAMRLTDWLALERFSSDVTSGDADRALARFIKR